MHYWLLKSEPDIWSIEQQKKAGDKSERRDHCKQRKIEFKYQGGTASIGSSQKPPPTASMVPNMKSIFPHSSSSLKPIFITKRERQKTDI